QGALRPRILDRLEAGARGADLDEADRAGVQRPAATATAAAALAGPPAAAARGAHPRDRDDRAPAVADRLAVAEPGPAEAIGQPRDRLQAAVPDGSLAALGGHGAISPRRGRSPACAPRTRGRTTCRGCPRTRSQGGCRRRDLPRPDRR